MAAPESVEDSEGRLDKVFLWRLATLLEAGIPDDVAGRLAEDRTIDIHRASDLAKAGCPPKLIAEILG